MTLRAEILTYIAEHPGTMAARVARALNASCNTCAILLRRMTTAGLVVRVVDPAFRGRYRYTVARHTRWVRAPAAQESPCIQKS
jgi:DNA-binding IclR family transcriptional regulator